MRSSTNEIIEIRPNKENNDGEFVEGLGFVCMEEGKMSCRTRIRAWAGCERKRLKNGKIYDMIRYR